MMFKAVPFQFQAWETSCCPLAPPIIYKRIYSGMMWGRTLRHVNVTACWRFWPGHNVISHTVTWGQRCPLSLRNPCHLPSYIMYIYNPLMFTKVVHLEAQTLVGYVVDTIYLRWLIIVLFCMFISSHCIVSLRLDFQLSLWRDVEMRLCTLLHLLINKWEKYLLFIILQNCCTWL